MVSCFSLFWEGIDPIWEEDAELEEDLPSAVYSPGPLEHDVLRDPIQHF